MDLRRLPSDVRIAIMLDSLDRLAEEAPALAVTLIMREYRGFSVKEVAESLGVSKGTVSKRLHRAQQRMIALTEQRLSTQSTGDAS